MDVERLPGGPWGQNAFLVVNGSSAIIVDPGGSAERILERVRERGVTLVGIINTHGHFDHIGGVTSIVAATGAPFHISARELPIMRTSNMLRFIFKIQENVVVPTEFVDLDHCGEHLELAGLEIKCIPTPGHTPGGHCFVVDEHLFSGDTLLRTKPASADLPGGDRDALAASLRLLATLPPTLVLHPGHGRDTTLGDALKAIDRNSDPDEATGARILP